MLQSSEICRHGSEEELESEGLERSSDTVLKMSSSELTAYTFIFSHVLSCSGGRQRQDRHCKERSIFNRFSGGL